MVWQHQRVSFLSIRDVLRHQTKTIKILVCKFSKASPMLHTTLMSTLTRSNFNLNARALLAGFGGSSGQSYRSSPLKAQPALASYEPSSLDEKNTVLPAIKPSGQLNQPLNNNRRVSAQKTSVRGATWEGCSLIAFCSTAITVTP